MMKRKANIVVIGGGISGLSIAYNLAKLGMQDVVVVEKSYLGSGSTGKCGTGIRQQFTTKEHIILMKESVKLWKSLSEELGIDVGYRQTGYIWLIRNNDELKLFRQNVKIQNSYGVPSKIISREEALEIVPYLNPDAFIAAAFCHTDGKASPFKTVNAYYEAGKKLGVEYYTFTEVVNIIVENKKIKRVVTSRGEIETNIVVNAAGYGARKIGEMVGINIPVENFRHHIVVTEPLREFIKPMVIRGKLYFTQTDRGGIIGGIDMPEPPDQPLKARLDFLETFAKNATEVMPVLRNINILRQWSGYYVVTEDNHPILGPTEKLGGFYIAAGYSGHGFMMGPIVGKLIAEYIVYDKPSIPIDSLSLERFEKGELIYEKAVIG